MDDQIKQLSASQLADVLRHMNGVLGRAGYSESSSICMEAAAALSEAQATIARLEAENARLRDALAPFADAAEECDDYGFDDMNQAPVDAGLCREARAALSPREGEG